MKYIQAISKVFIGTLIIVSIIMGSAATAHAGFFSFLDKVQLKAQVSSDRPNVPVACNYPIYARVSFSRNPNSNFGVRNWGLGDLERKIFVGGSSDTNKYAGGKWFKIYDGQNAVIDHEITSYEDVKGLAVQRGDGWLRLVLHGTWTEPENDSLKNRERAEGTIQFSTDGKTVSSKVVPTRVVTDPEPGNVIEPTGNYASSNNTNHPQNDKIDIVDKQSYFKFVVTTNDDGYYTYYKNVDPACK